MKSAARIIFGAAALFVLAVGSASAEDRRPDLDPVLVPAGATKAEIQVIVDSARAGQEIVFRGTYDFSEDPGLILIDKHVRLRSDDLDPAYFRGEIGDDGRAKVNADNRLFRFQDAGVVDVEAITAVGFDRAYEIVGDTTEIRIRDTNTLNTLSALFAAPDGLENASVVDNEMLDVERGIQVVSLVDVAGVEVTGNRVVYFRAPLPRQPRTVFAAGINLSGLVGVRLEGNSVSGFDEPSLFGVPGVCIVVWYWRGGLQQGPKITGNVAENCSVGLVLQNQPDFPDGSGEMPVALLVDSLVEDNEFQNNDYGVFMWGAANGYRVLGNHFRRNAQADVVLTGDPDSTFPLSQPLDIAIPPGFVSTFDNFVSVPIGTTVIDEGNDAGSPNTVEFLLGQSGRSR